MKGLWIAALIAIPCLRLPAPAVEDCGLAFTDLLDPRLGYSYMEASTSYYIARQFTLQSPTDILSVKLYLKRWSGHGAVRLDIRQDACGKPAESSIASTSFLAESIPADPAWCNFPALACHLLAGKYWIALWVDHGDPKIDWLLKPGNYCGAVDDHMIQRNASGNWEWTTGETNYEVVCSACPELSGGRTSPAEPNDNKQRTYEYYVTYKNSAGNPPTTSEVRIDGGEPKTMHVLGSHPDYRTGATFFYSEFTQLGVGQHSFEFDFATADGHTAHLSGSGPLVHPGYPKITRTSYTPNPAKTGQTITFDCSATDTDGSIAQYRWELVRQDASGYRSFTTSSSTKDKPADEIGVGRWKVLTTVIDDSSLSSGQFVLNDPKTKNPVLLDISDGLAPDVTNVTATVDGRPDAKEVGVFVPGLGIYVPNKFTAAVQDNGGGIGKVEFKMPHRSLGTQTITDYSSPYEATFDMDQLPDPDPDPNEPFKVLQVVAYNNSGTPGSVMEIATITAARPSWWGASWVYSRNAVWEETKRRYTFSCYVPDNPRLNYDYPIDTGGYFGYLSNHFESDVRIVEHFNIGGSPTWWDYSASGTLDATVLGKTLLRQSCPGKQFTTTNISHAWSRNLDRYELSSPAASLFKWSIEGPSWDYRGVADYVEYHVGLSVDVGFEASMRVDATLNPNLSVRELGIVPTPAFSVGFDAFVEIYEGLARLGVRADPTLSLDLPIVYAFGNPGEVFADNPCLKFQVPYKVYASAVWGWVHGDLYSGQYPDQPYCYPPTCSGGLMAQNLTADTAKPLFVAPTVASDKKGASSVCVWVHDTNPDPMQTDPELYYSYYPDPNDEWSQPAPVFLQNNQRFETDPKVTYTAQNQAMLVWTQNELSKEQAEPTAHIMDLLKQQELYYTTWTYNPATKTGFWTQAVNKITHDDPPNAPFGDGLVSLAAHENTGRAIAVWVRESYNNPGGQRTPEVYNSTWDIYTALWNGAAWSAPQSLLAAGDSTADAQPDVAMDSNGNAIAVWVRDQDNDFTTNSDRLVAYRSYDGGTAAWGPLTLEPSWPEGALSPAVTYDLANKPIILFTSRGSNSKGQAIQEGPSERLYSACFGGGAPVVAPVGPAGDPPRALEPKVRCDSQNYTVAIWRGFQGEGSQGFDGEVAMNLRYSGLPDCSNWGAAAYLTDDAVTDWQVDFDVDPSDMARIVWVKKEPPSGDPGFGNGYDSIFLTEISRGPDLLVGSEDISFSNDRPAAGEPVVITARVHNRGSRPAGPFDVKFRSEAGDIATQRVGTLAPQSFTDLHQTWVSDGRVHLLGAIADSSGEVAETNEGNNTGVRFIGKLPAPTDLSAYADAAMASIMLTWAHSGGADHFHVHRSTTSGGGYEMLGDCTDTAYSDTTAAINTTYYYVVTAVDSNGVDSPASSEAAATLGPDNDADGIPDVADPDDDNDSMPDAWEVAHGFNPLDPSDASQDADGDGFTNLEECQAGTDPNDPASHPDITPPETPSVSAGPYSTSASELSASWTCSDDYSGIAGYDYAIGTIAGGTDVREWTSNGTSNALTATGLSLANGQTYYMSVRATDGAGNQSTVGISPGVIVDTTAPAVTDGPTVEAWTPETSIAARWYAEDPESLVRKYEYSVGTEPGETDVVGWSDVGFSLQMEHTGLTLTNGQQYYVNVRVTNGAGLQTVASSGPTRAVKQPATIADALELANDTWLVLQHKMVSGSSGDYRWIEEMDRTAGLRLETTIPLSEPQKITVMGQLVTPVYTRQVAVETIELETGGTKVDPVGMSNKAVGGGDRNALTPGVAGGVGLNNVGLLVTTCGMVTAAEAGFFYIDDGSALDDGTSHKGIRVKSEGLSNPDVDTFAIVTGLVEAAQLVESGPSVRLIVPRRQADIR